jgi:prefoldin subunit 5
MFSYEISINWAGNIHKEVIECENNEESKRAVKKKMKELGIPVGKYVFIDIKKLDDEKIIVEEELWKV